MKWLSGDERFDRYYRRIRLGLRLMSHGARAQTASDWSGLTLDQLATLSASVDAGRRGRFSGTGSDFLFAIFRSALKASHAAMFVGIIVWSGLITEAGLEGGRSSARPMNLCGSGRPLAHLEFDHGVLLATGAMKGGDIELTNCADSSARCSSTN